MIPLGLGAAVSPVVGTVAMLISTALVLVPALAPPVAVAALGDRGTRAMQGAVVGIEKLV